MKKLLMIICSFIVAACSTTYNNSGLNQNNPFTHGNVQLTLKKGVTTQSDIIDKFGAPNVTTIDASGREVWTYQKHATVSNSSESGVYGTVILLGAASRSTGFEQSTRTMTLIIKFDEDKKVSDFKSMSTSF